MVLITFIVLPSLAKPFKPSDKILPYFAKGDAYSVIISIFCVFSELHSSQKLIGGTARASHLASQPICMPNIFVWES